MRGVPACGCVSKKSAQQARGRDIARTVETASPRSWLLASRTNVACTLTRATNPPPLPCHRPSPCGADTEEYLHRLTSKIASVKLSAEASSAAARATAEARARGLTEEEVAAAARAAAAEAAAGGGDALRGSGDAQSRYYALAHRQAWQGLAPAMSLDPGSSSQPQTAVWSSKLPAFYDSSLRQPVFSLSHIYLVCLQPPPVATPYLGPCIPPTSPLPPTVPPHLGPYVPPPHPCSLQYPGGDHRPAALAAPARRRHTARVPDRGPAVDGVALQQPPQRDPSRRDGGHLRGRGWRAGRLAGWLRGLTHPCQDSAPIGADPVSPWPVDPSYKGAMRLHSQL